MEETLTNTSQNKTYTEVSTQDITEFNNPTNPNTPQQLITTVMYYIRLIFTIITPIFFTTLIIELAQNLNIMVNNSPYIAYKDISINLTRPAKTMISIIIFSIYLLLNIIYYIPRTISLIRPGYNTPVYNIYNNISVYIKYIYIPLSIFILVPSISTIIYKYIIIHEWLILIINGFFILQLVYIISEIIFNYINTFQYTVYTPSSERMKITFISIYYINHIIILLLCMVLIMHSTEFIPMTVLESIYINRTISTVNNTV
ncbi:hypothetical protein NEPAR06_0510 [Nematocida parisii]|uniref:Uncharacterized protein n=1 Tax=Nematocida parisii (strain ERTm3) TaxID=935791 RepID=I3EJE2_NEMP3|nr:uncharacterized protein NEPG_01129 [Nematocida parisii ERTm1]EIJ89339.1 hypothetical protein NEQG_00109 [Nematocida parisii ERTm3]KAI5142572.1 hypothetical protein NEPAR07_0177 [Nematocida parisii]EIJ94461.1 hypothetical protein NEPG_01129 [Nematocida parisii ERTm1]KAI5153510.1 hypothetical protein NEPAR06_0510 [Nematocida parisii]KAI5156933.1 hypothetical protein NEPAR05_0916 [Nematocida parisii]|eukprot:XP_013058957.1 hypothetical protein NEPG_01129 [Nematocida parisii ERTm1]